MGIEQFLTNEDKLSSLEKIKKLIAIEIYSLCLRASIDPDEFDYSTYIPPVNYREIPYLEMLTKQCNSLKIVEQKIQDISNAD